MATPTAGFVNQATQGCTNAYPVPTTTYPGNLVYHDPSGALVPFTTSTTLKGESGFCAPVDPSNGEIQSPPYYGYNPSEGAGIAFVVLFSLLLIAHIGLWALSRRIWLIVLVIGAIGELIGWAGRLWSGVENDYSTGSYNAFLMQICCLTISPAFFSATAYGIFTLLVARINPEISRFKPRTLVKVFVGADILSLVLQAAGGGIASGADDGSDTQKTGTNLFLAGIAFQLASMIVFTLLTLEYFVKIVRRRDIWNSIDQKIKLLYYGNLIGSAFIVFRCPSSFSHTDRRPRWNGYLITHEGLFLGLDASLMVCCLFTYAICHPAFLLPKETPVIQETEKVESSGSSTREAKMPSL